MKANPGVLRIEPFDPDKPTGEYAASMKRMQEQGMSREEAIERIKGYTRRNFLGSAALSDCVHAKYSRKGQEPLTVFVVAAAESQTLDQTWRALSDGHKISKAGVRPMVAWEIPYRGTVVVVRGERSIYGAVDTGDAAAVTSSLRLAIGRPGP